MRYSGGLTTGQSFAGSGLLPCVVIDRSRRVQGPITTRARQLLRWATVCPQLTWAEKWGLLYIPLFGELGIPI